jgi:hypothetical protein
MTTKYTANGVEKSLQSAILGFHGRARAAREEYQTERRAILQNDRLSEAAKRDDIAKLGERLSSTLKGIKAEQDAHVSTLQRNIATELRGSQPDDANSVMLRRDAAERVRKIGDEKEALDVLTDAIRAGDDGMADAIGFQGRQSGWINVLDAYKAARPDTADTAAALALVEGLDRDGGYNFSNSVAYSDATD